jgi:L-threonylcarbamoyladenylate synthase
MKVVYVDTNNSEKIKLAVEDAVDFLKQGRVIVYPTDTIYGLGCDALNEEAVKKIYAIKKRGENKPVSVIVKDIDSIGKIAFLDRKNKVATEKLLPGPYTLIFPGPKNIPKIITGGENSIGVRMPDNKICQEIASAFPNPIVTTSVNLSGEDDLNDPFKIVDYFKDKELAPDLILDCGKIKEAQPSIVVDLTRKSPQILRSGARSLKEIRELLNKLK